VGQLGEEFFVELHEVLIVAVGLIKLEHGEFGIVLGGNTLVAEIAIDFEDAIKAADGEPLKIELRRDAKVKINIKRVVMGDKRPGGGTTSDGVHHGCFYFDVAPGIKKIAQLTDDAGSRFENFAGPLVGNEVEIAMAIAQLHVGQTMPFLRERKKSLGKGKEFLYPNGELARLGPEHVAAHTDVIAKIQQMEQLEAFFAYHVFSHVNLYLLTCALQVSETSLAHQPVRNDAPRNPSFDPVGLKVGCGRVTKLGEEVGRGVGPTERARKGFVAKRLNLFEFLLPLQKLVLGLEMQEGGIPFQNG